MNFKMKIVCTAVVEGIPYAILQEVFDESPFKNEAESTDAVLSVSRSEVQALNAEEYPKKYRNVLVWLLEILKSLPESVYEIRFVNADWHWKENEYKS